MKYRLLLFLLAVSVQLSAQTPYGNDWIVFSQTYYKIKVAENGVYRINQSQFQQAGAPLSSINARNIQLFHQGKEVPIYIAGEFDGKLDAGDFIEFYGEKNDGKLDKALYSNPADQPHDFYSLYTDTAAYFLTWSASVPGKRYINTKIRSTGLTPESYFMYTSSSFFTDGGYYPGEYILAAASLSEYTAGEGFLGSQYGLGGSQVRSVATPNFDSSAPEPSRLESFVAGRSNSASTNTQGYNHHLRIEASSNGSAFNTKKDTLFKAYQTVRSNVLLNAADIGANTQIRFSSVNDLGAVTDFQAPGYIIITYARKYNLVGLTELLFNVKASGASTLLKFSNSALTKPLLLDLNNMRRIIADQISGSLEAVLPATVGDRNLFLYDSTAFKPTILNPVQFTNLNPSSSDKDFLLITHQSLLPAAQDYANYRSQSGYKPLLITTDQLYDQFFYGVHHPLAIHNFAAYMLAKAAVKPAYMLLLGKGQSNLYVRNAQGLAADLIPSIGNPPSDELFTSGLNGTNWEPAIATGRIAAQTNNDVSNYLNKLKTYESEPDSLWRKNIINVSGGNTLSENISWSGFQRAFQKIAEGEYFGAHGIEFHKFVNEPITDNLRLKIAAEINKGASLLSFFGHGTAQATEVNFGEPADLQNQGNLLVYLINGCDAGNPFTTLTLGEKLIFEPNKGAVGWLATSDEGVVGYLAQFTNIFYKNAFNLYYGKSIAEIIKQTIKSYQNPNDKINQAHARQYLWQGDPALKFYSPAKPDYFIENIDLFIYPSNATAVSDSFAVAIVAKNLGKALDDSLSISITRTLPDNSVVQYPARNFKPVFNIDTLFYYIKSNDVKTGGNNKFVVTIDANNSKLELSESNNTAQLDFIMPVNGVNILYPKKYAIVGDAAIELKAQSNTLLIGSAEYIFEIDTVKSFSSSWKKSSGILSDGFMPTWKPAFTPENKRVYYWRVRFNLPIDQGGDWQESSFTYIAGSPDGWNQSHFQQFENTGLKNIVMNSAERRFRFENSTFYTSIQTRGDDAPTTLERTFRSEPGGKLAFRGMEFTGFTLIAMDPATLNFYSYPSPYNYYNGTTTEDVNGYTGQFYFDLNSAVDVDSLVGYVNNIPQGYYVVGYNGRNISLKDMPQRAKDAFANLGTLIINNVNPGEPYMFWGQKGGAPGSAIEKIADPASATPARSQVIKFNYEYPFPFDNGSYTSEKAGPSQKWSKVFYNFLKEPEDSIQISLIGVEANGAETVLVPKAPADSLDLSTIDASIYPYLRLKVAVSDNVNRTPAQLKGWKFLYQEYPEGTINPELKNVFYAKTIQEGDSVKWQLSYQNISKYTTDSIQLYYELTKADRSTTRKFVKSYAPLNPSASLTADLRLPTLGLKGANVLKLEFLPKNLRDSYNFNNYLAQNFTVQADEKAPFVDVVFDGKHIVNSEIVSPSPEISVSLLDENTFILLNDTTVLDVYIKRQDESTFHRVSYSSGKLIFAPAGSTSTNKATVMYKPDKLADGIYTLRVEGRDKTGNINLTNSYEIDFEVVNESAISNFYPYPNPFTTSMKFVFTLTGDKIPDKIRIQILTITGKIVREVLKDELGPLRIGNNVSAFSWDGTDQFGDRLANGVYFYNVMVENSDKAEIKHRQTSGDKFFKNNYGKIYLMR
ncbi:MAG: hypothetical protein K0S09_194 [Sphingobacteriaceae bacterium]|jgi:hypothetical protein|nr:hypothetical protein [Sphingobacteriaceae bacterium]